jgi:hypothetical protein|tara:strand:+ start:1960 stop:2364 length:405 start_codon:yes stop_codon:yes gene_type:complete
VILLRRYQDFLEPHDEKALKKIQTIKSGDWVTCEIKKVRSARQTRKWWALIGKVSANTSYTKRQLHNNLLCHLGYCDQFTDKNGVVVRDPHSISAGNMPQDEFNQLFDDAVNWICEGILPVAPEELRRELEEMI